MEEEEQQPGTEALLDDAERKRILEQAQATWEKIRVWKTLNHDQRVDALAESASQIHSGITIQDVQDFLRQQEGPLDDEKRERILEQAQATLEQNPHWITSNYDERVATLAVAASQIHSGITKEDVQDFLKPSHQLDIRVRDTGYGIVETQLIGGLYELFVLEQETKNLFKWYDHRQTMLKYSAPLKPIIQCSGAGKTKLIHEFCKYLNRRESRSGTSIHARFCSCIPKATRRASRTEDFYDAYIDTGGKETTISDTLQGLFDGIVSEFDTSANGPELKIVVFLDEAQALSKDAGNGLFALRRCLRKKRTNAQIVCFVTGTTTALGDCYPSREDRKSSRAGENNSEYYECGDALYDPIFEFYTMGCYARNIKFPPSTKPNHRKYTELDQAIPFGRPLFARLLLEESFSGPFPTLARMGLTDSDRAIIATRMLLNRTSLTNDADCLPSVVSVWATRIQLESSHTALVNDLVSRGYAFLTKFSFWNTTSEGPRPSVGFTHLPDPVCAYLAAGLMTPGWKLEAKVDNDSRRFKGQPKSFWVEKLRSIFATGLCLAPRGNIGEMLSAAYLLFCADELRAPRLQEELVSVPVSDWVSCAQSPFLREDGASKKRPKLEADAAPPTINILQFCRCSLRFGLEDYCHQKFLEWIYNSCCGLYAYAGCPMFDCVVAAKCGRDCYVPVLISIKTVVGFSEQAAKKCIDTMVKQLVSRHIQAALVLVVSLDSGYDRNALVEETEDEGKTKGQQDSVDPQRRGSKDGKRSWQAVATASHREPVTRCSSAIVSRFIAIPEKDPFSITESVRTITASLCQEDLYASHHMFGVVEPRILRGTRKKQGGSTSSILLKECNNELKARFERLWHQGMEGGSSEHPQQMDVS